MSHVRHASILPILINTLRLMLLAFPPPCLGHGCTRFCERMEGLDLTHTRQQNCEFSFSLLMLSAYVALMHSHKNSINSVSGNKVCCIYTIRTQTQISTPPKYQLLADWLPEEITPKAKECIIVCGFQVPESNCNCFLSQTMAYTRFLNLRYSWKSMIAISTD